MERDSVREYNYRTRGLKLKEDRFRLDIRKKLFTMTVVMQWMRLLREVVHAPSLKARLDGNFGQHGLVKDP